MKAVPWFALSLLAGFCIRSTAQTAPASVPQPTSQQAAASPASIAMEQTKAEKARKTIEDAKADGVSMTVVPHVDKSVNIEAVMLPEDVVRRVFGREVSEHYAVVEVNISNRSKDAGFVLQSLFIDYSHWLLANPFNSEEHRSTKNYQSRGSTREISSVEYRIVRGEMLDAQPWTRRNEWARGIKVLGSIGTAFAFPFSRDVVAGINAWNGGVVPGFEQLFPDGTDAQINRVSDYGFRDNKIIPQQSSDIVMAFFPIGRFLTPSLRSIFLKSPALLFNPVLLALDPKSRKDVEPILEQAILGLNTPEDAKGNGSTEKEKVAANKADKKVAVDAAFAHMMKNLAGIDTVEVNRLNDELAEKNKAVKSLTQDRKLLNKSSHKSADTAAEVRELAAAEDKIALATRERDVVTAQLAHEYAALRNDPLFRILQQISLENVNVVVSGIMTVDQSVVPATITDSCFTHADPGLLSTAGTKTCYLKGQFLAGGVPKFLADADNPIDPGISNIVVNKDANTSDFLQFTFDLKQPITTTKFDIVVTKPGQSDQPVDSMPYRVTTAALAAPTILSAIPDATTGSLVVKGTNFVQTTAIPISVKLQLVDKSADVPVTDATVAIDQITIPAADLTGPKAGCYDVVVTTLIGEATSPGHLLIGTGATCP